MCACPALRPRRDPRTWPVSALGCCLPLLERRRLSRRFKSFGAQSRTAAVETVGPQAHRGGTGLRALLPRAARTSGQAAEVARGAEGLAQAGRASKAPSALSKVGPVLVALVLLWPSSTAGPESDSRPPWVDAQREFEARLLDVAEESRQLMVELEAQPRATKTPAWEPSPRKQPATALPQEEDDPRCKPIPLPRHRGGHDPHNDCADKMPGNTFPGGDVYVNGKNFDALQLATRTLWEVKTDDFEKQPPRSQRFFVEMKLPEIQRERRLAEECGFKFVVGVRSEVHKAALLRADSSLDVVAMNWC